MATERTSRKKLWAILALLILLLAWIWLTGRNRRAPPAAEPATTAAGRGQAAPTAGGGETGFILVDFHNEVSREQIESLARQYGLRLRPNSRFSWGERLFRTAVRRSSERVEELVSRLRQEPAVESAEAELLYGIPPLDELAGGAAPAAAPAKGPKFPNDPQYRFQWHLDQINMPQAWRAASGKGVIVAVIDTGVAYRDQGRFRRVPDLAQTEFVAGYDFVNKREEALDDHGHGTHVAGTIAQSTNNGIGVAGVAYRARIMPLKVLSARGFGSVADIAEAMRFATDHGARIINMSLGGARPSKILEDAVRYAHGKGVVVVCAAGNAGAGRVSYPAAYPGAIAVAATQFDRKTTFYSNWGKQIALAAPGGNTRVDQNGDGMPDGVLQNTIVPGRPEENDYLLFMGTSMASPHVAGAAALLVERGVNRPDAVLRLLKSTARHPEGKSWDPHYGAGIVDAGGAVRKAGTETGGYALGLAALLGLLLLYRLRARGLQVLRPRGGALAGMMLGASGLCFLPWVGAGGWLPDWLLDLSSRGMHAWDVALLGPAWHATPLFSSALLPVTLSVVLYGVERLRGLLFGIALGFAGALLVGALLRPADVIWIPNVLLLDEIWLAVNALVCLGLASLLARR